MNAIAWVYIVGGLLFLGSAVIPSRSSTLTRSGAGLFGVGAVLVGITRLQAHQTPITYVGSVVFIVGAVVYLIGTLRDRRRR